MLFTPLISRNSNERLSMEIDEAAFERSKIGKGNGMWVAAVTDLNTGKRYAVRDNSCGRGCHCDARILKEIPNRSVH